MIEVCERKDFTWFTTPFQGVSGAKMFCDVNDDAPSVSVVAVLSTYGYIQMTEMTDRHVSAPFVLQFHDYIHSLVNQ